jgi:hypothetical protein
MPGATPESRRAHYEAMVDTLAALHNIDVEGSALAISESPETISGGRWNAGPGNIACRKPKPWTRWSS